MPNKSQLYFISQAPTSSEALDYFTPTDAVYPAGTPAIPVGVNNHPLVAFLDGADCYVDFPGVLPITGVVEVTLLWASNANAGDVLWSAAWERDNATSGAPQADLNVDTFAAAKTVLSVAPPAVGLLRSASVSFNAAEMGDLQPGEAYRLRIRRDAGVAPDTLVGDARLFRVILGGA